MSHYVSLALGLCALGCCNHDRVNAFSVSLPTEINTVTVCKGDPVEVRWDVHGDAALGTATGGPDVHHEPGDFTMTRVTSTDRKVVNVEQSTTFRIVAIGANPANDGSFADQYAIVPVAPIDKGNTATCDATKCKTSFTLDASRSMIVRWVGEPRIAQSGTSKGIKICVSHDGGPPVCVDPDGTANVGRSAAGTWTLEADLPADMQPTPPPLLKLHFDFGCS